MSIWHVYTVRKHPTGVIVERLVGTFADEDVALIDANRYLDQTRIVEQPERRATTYRRRKGKP